MQFLQNVIAQALCAILCIGVAHAAVEPDQESPWHELTIPIPNRIEKIKLNVRQCHPMMAEYEYKVSGKLANGKTFTENLSVQTGGLPLLTIDYISEPGKDGHVRFKLHDGCCLHPESISLTTGSIEGCESDRSRVKPLGFIGNDLKFYKPTAWNVCQVFAELDLHSGRKSEMVKSAQAELNEALRLKDKELIGTSLEDLAFALEKTNQGTEAEIEKLYSTAVLDATETLTARSDGAKVSPKWSVLRNYGCYCSRIKRYVRAKECFEQAIRLIQSRTPEGKEELLKSLRFEIVRLELLQQHLDAANDLARSVELGDEQKADEKRRLWKELYPFIALLENDIRAHLRTDPANNVYSVEAKFAIPSDREHFPTVDFIATQGHLNVCKYATYFALIPALKYGPPFPTKEPVYCNLHLVAGREGTEVTVTPAYNVQKMPQTGCGK